MPRPPLLAAVTLISLALSVLRVSTAHADDFTLAIQQYLELNLAAHKKAALVIGLVDEHGQRTISHGTTGNEADLPADGDTLFEIGSDAKTFTTLLLADMVARDEMRLDDPVASYLPARVKLPARNGKQITLRHLATHTSGLPPTPDNLDPDRADNPYAQHTLEKLDAFLARYKLTRDPGHTSEYSNLGMGLLGHAIAAKAGDDFESLVRQRICQPLGMTSTTIALTSDLQRRFAVGHNRYGEPVPAWTIPTLAAAGALRSTANDLLKYLAAHAGITPTPLAAAMHPTHEQRLAWFTDDDPLAKTTIYYHGGGTGGFRSFTGFDKSNRRGVVILANIVGAIDLDALGKFLLRADWNSNRVAIVPAAAAAPREDLASYVGEYDQPSPQRTAIQSLLIAINSIVIWLFIASVVIAAILMYRAATARQRWTTFGILVLALAILDGVHVLALMAEIEIPAEPTIGIRRADDRLIARTISTEKWSPSIALPPADAALTPRALDEFLEPLSGRPLAFTRAHDGAITGLTAHTPRGAVHYQKTSNAAPPPPQPIALPAAISLDEPTLDAYVGDYDFPESNSQPAGFHLKIWREGPQLLARATGPAVIQGAFEIYPKSPNEFFTRINEAELTFIKNDEGEVTHLLHKEPDGTERKGDRVSDSPNVLAVP